MSSNSEETSIRAPRRMNVAMQHLQPPPPPPPPPAVPSINTSQLHVPVYHSQSPQPSTSSGICHPPTPVPIFRFDASRPPPPIHTHVQLNNNISKRPMINSCTATPSKLRKTEEPKPEEAICDLCVQRDISIESSRIKMEQIRSEDEFQTLLYKKKENEYLRHKDVLRSLVDNNLFRKIENFVEGRTSSPNQKLLNFIEYFLSDSSEFESSQSVRAEDSLRQTLSAISRFPGSRSSPHHLQTLQDVLYNNDRTSSSEPSGYRGLTVERATSSGTNGLSTYRQYSNGHMRVPDAASTAPASAPVAPPAPPPPPPAVTYPHYPPPRPYYPPPYPPAPRASTSWAPVPPRPPHAETYPPPYYYYQ